MSAATGRLWWHGLIAAVVGGAAGAVDSALALMLINPDQFDLGPNLATTLQTVTVIGLLTGLKCAAAYLKQSPVPWNGVERRET